MRAFTAGMAILASAWAFVPAVSQEEAPSPPIENVIVTQPVLRTEKALDNFIIAHAARSPFLDKMGRWKTGICPITVGLPDKFALYISQRIIRMAMATGAPLDKGETCRPNVVVLATSEPQKVLDFIADKRPALLGFHYRGERRRLATMTLPIQAWYATATEDAWGLISADLPSWDLGYGVMSTMTQVRNFHVSGSRVSNGLKTEFTTAVIIVDTNKIAGQEIGPVADYVAMLALSQGQVYDTCQDVPTITNLMAPDCAADMKPAAITDVDMTYLRGLYKMDLGGTYIGERGAIADEMKKELGGY